MKQLAYLVPRARLGPAALCIVLLACASALASTARAQDASFPSKGPIELTVLFPAGSSADVTARVLADGMGKNLQTNVVVVDRPGAGGAIGYKYVAAQKPDGYALVWNSNSISTTHYSGQLGFDYHAFDPVAQVLVESPLLVVRGDARWKTLADFMADAKAHPGRLTVGNSGTGSHTHICSVALFKAAGVQVIDVPFGVSQVVPSLLGGQVDALMQLPGAVATYIKSGQLRALAALTSRRDPALADVPTAAEQGIDVSLEAWRGVAVPKNTPRAVIEKLEAAIRKTVQSPQFIAASQKLAVRPAFMPAADFGKIIAQDDQKLARLMELIGLARPASR